MQYLLHTCIGVFSHRIIAKVQAPKHSTTTEEPSYQHNGFSDSKLLSDGSICKSCESHRLLPLIFIDRRLPIKVPAWWLQYILLDNIISCEGKGKVRDIYLPRKTVLRNEVEIWELSRAYALYWKQQSFSPFLLIGRLITVNKTVLLPRNEWGKEILTLWLWDGYKYISVLLFYHNDLG